MNRALLRRAKPGDIDEVLRLSQMLFDHELQYDSASNVDWPKSSVAREFFLASINDAFCCLAEVEGKVVGYAVGSSRKPSTATEVRSELDQMFVEPAFRRQGLGKAFLAEFVKWSASVGAASMHIALFEHNREAMAFYESIGFKRHVATLDAKVSDL